MLISLRQRAVLLVGFVTCTLLISAAFSYQQIEQRINHTLEDIAKSDREFGRMYSYKSALAEGCCAARPHELEEKRIPVAPIHFMDPMDMVRANLDPKYKQGKYLLFVDRNGRVLVLDLDAPCASTGVEP